MKKSKKWILPTLVVLLLGAGGSAYAWISGNETTRDDAPTYQEVAVKKGEIRIDFEADASASLPVTKVAFPTSGVLASIEVQSGDVVEQGTLLASLDPADIHDRIAEAEAAYQQAVLQREKTVGQRADAIKNELARLDPLTQQVESAQRKYDSMRTAPEAFSTVELADAEAALTSAQTNLSTGQAAYSRLAADDADVALADLAVERAAMAVEQAHAPLAETDLYAPIAGTVIEVPAVVGSAVSTSSDIVLIAAQSGPEVQASVSELDVADIEVGQAVEVTFEALEDTPYRGQVLGIDPLALQDGNGLVSYAVQLSLDKPDDRIRDGMTGTVDFILREKTGILILPNTAIRMVDGTQMVTVRNDAGEVVFAPVTTGLTDGRQVEILSGLNAGDVVLIAEK
jgi:multidrug efflux pump subunit AcrA (membrane-fusion protein)